MREDIIVSVVIPIYNVSKWIDRGMDVILSQSLKEIEVLLVDDGSTDNSINILNEYAKKDFRIKILTQKNQYAGIARNNGMKISKGKFIAFMDSDDLYPNNFTLEFMFKNAIKKQNTYHSGDQYCFRWQSDRK